MVPMIRFCLAALLLLTGCAAKAPKSKVLTTAPQIQVTVPCLKLVGFVPNSKCQALQGDLTKCEAVVFRVLCEKVVIK